ncbi:MAG: transposase, partial [Verrucomicrobiales bacterium]|nr:transposase [Verrucomicrobiales bacterium]
MATHFRTPAGVPAASPQHPVADPLASLPGCELFAHVREHRHAMGEAQRRAAWAVNHCRTAEMGGHLHACGSCGKREFHFHSCNHRSCPQCGKRATADWVERQLGKRVGAPYFMVTFTLPEELRPLFFTAAAKDVYQLFFSAASSALSDTLANPKWLGAKTSGFITVLHTWNQRLHFHPHLHCIVPGAGLDAAGRVVTVKNARFLVPQPALRIVFRGRFRDALAGLTGEHPGLPAIDPAVWHKDWGVHLQPFGSGENIIKDLGRYVCRTAIGDSRIVSVTDTHVTFRYKDRAKGDAPRVETITGAEFTARYLRHVLPQGLRAIRYHGFLHPAAKAKRERIAFHTGRPLLIGAAATTPPKPPHVVKC